MASHRRRHGNIRRTADERCSVRGIAGLYIADASLMPRGLTVPPNLTLMAMGERIGSWIRGAIGGQSLA
jgi:choline dehydrogenase-like flavoprotein